eukprot:CAMPEP_0198225056 /NCGR_PEP_ID=MMETSP1445-20131203/99487_1 /TAXON_ID=36898 /ORGANISM="Pyramimonas sp., Strain CCMP2087" /LENGTH=88 /DNA_ID=CAMNT_0043904437 /DNA_START=217 /DNA_END=483 /DNA_ORIENTATION=-
MSILVLFVSILALLVSFAFAERTVGRRAEGHSWALNPTIGEFGLPGGEFTLSFGLLGGESDLASGELGKAMGEFGLTGGEYCLTGAEL